MLERLRPFPLKLIKLEIWEPAWGGVLALLLGLLLVRLPWQIGAGLVGGTAVILLIFIQPLVGLGFALLLGPFGALESVIFGNPVLDSGQVALFLTFLAWISHSLRRRQFWLPRTFLTFPLLLFLSVSTLSLFNAPSLAFGFREWLKWVEIILIMLIIVDLSQSQPPGGFRTSRRLIYIVAGALLLTGLLQAGIGIWQFGFRGDGPTHFIVLDRFYRAYGTFEQPNPFGGFMHLTGLFGLGMALGFVNHWWTNWRHDNSWTRQHIAPAMVAVLFVGISTGATILALLLSWSRGAWLSFGVGTAVLIFFWPRQRQVGLLLLGLGGVGLLVALQFNLIPASILDRLVSFSQDLRFGDVRGVAINDANYAILERLAHWQAALNMARDNIWLGVGFGNYEPAYASYALINWPDPLGHAHNYYLNLLAEVGVLGLASYLLLWTAVFWQTIRALRTEDSLLRGIALGLLAAWVALTVHHLTDKLYVNNIYVHLGVMLGLLQLIEEKVARGRVQEASSS